MARLIDADALCRHLSDWQYGSMTDGKHDVEYGVIENVIEGIEKEPTIDAEPVRHGKWIPCAKNGLILTEQMRLEGIRWYGFKCSACNFVRKGNAHRDANYCECCGARMDKDE